MAGYNTDFVKAGAGQAGGQMRHTIGLPNSGQHKSRSNTLQQESIDKPGYQPVPDGRFYTKANFFTVGDREQASHLLTSHENPIPDIDIRQDFRLLNQSTN